MSLGRVAAASLASVFLALTAIAAAIMPSHGQSGFLVHLPVMTVGCAGDFGDTTTTVAALRSSGTVQFGGSTLVKIEAFRPKVRDTFKTRGIKHLYVYVWPDSDVLYRDFVEVVENALPEVDKIGWLTPAMTNVKPPWPCPGRIAIVPTIEER
jgi:hypothetical protein